MIANNQIYTLIRDYKNTENSFLPHFVTVPLSDEKGKNTKAIVKAGDIVKEGQIIAQTPIDSSTVTFIHSPVPGTVVDCIPCVSPNGKHNFGIKIKTGGNFAFVGKKHQKKTTDLLSASTILSSLVEKGIVNTFNISAPENLGLQIQNNKKASCLIVRMYDEDIHRITDSLVSKFYFKEIIEGAQAVAKAFNANGIVFAVDAKNEMKDLIDSVSIPNVRFVQMQIEKYPCGNAREIISNFNRAHKKTCNFAITKYDIFTDASTIYDAYNAIFLGIPSINKLVHFSGNCLYASCLLNIKVGTSIQDIINQIGGFMKEPKAIIVNGKLSGTSVTSLDIPITKTVKSIEFNSHRTRTDEHVYSCINCGNCRSACPVHISPDILYNNAIKFHEEKKLEKSASACSECGLCNTVCPARLPLAQTINLIKKNLKSTGAEQ